MPVTGPEQPESWPDPWKVLDDMSDFVSRLALSTYNIAGLALVPFSGLFLHWRARKGKEDRKRLRERYGIASAEPDGRVCVWVHAASLGETRAVLPLVRRLVDMQFQVVFTTVTVAAASIAALELPKGAVHQFASLDLRPFVARFLKHWQPALALFVESELWPTTMLELRRRNIAQILVNARMSERTFSRWRKNERISHTLFENVSLCISQTEEDATRFRDLGFPSVINSGNLKFDAELPEVESLDLSRVQTAIGRRPVWLAASTHDREELIVGKAHRNLKQYFPNVLTIIAPRHPDRAPEILKQLGELGLSVSQRSRNALPQPNDDIYLADSIGELALFYSVVPCSLIGGSLVPHGGQNPIEPARLGSAVLHGPNVANFANIYETLAAQGGCVCVRNSEELVRRIAELLNDPQRVAKMTKAASAALEQYSGALDRTHRALLPYLNPLIVAGRLKDVETRDNAGA